MLFKNKKSSLELSIRTIVVVVLAMTLLGLGLGFIRSMFENLGETTFSVQDQIKQQILEDLRTGDKKLSFPTSEIKIGKQASKILAVGVKNTEEISDDFYIWLYVVSGGGNEEQVTSTILKPNLGTFVWDDGAQGNYWSDHGSRYPGSVSDGTIWNTPYGMEGTAGSADRYPLVRPGEPEFTDATPPTITADNSFISGTTGDPYEFNISAWDDTGVLSVKVNYSHGLLKGNLTLAGNNDHWSGSITLDDSVDDLNYSIYINDTVGNLCSSEPKFIVVTDNDPPAFIDHSRNNGTTGDIFEFNISALDNIGVETVQVNWSHGGRVDNLTLKEIGGRWYGKIGITNNTSDLTYWVNVTDNSGNLFISTPYNISVLDNDAPVAAAGPDQVAYLYEKIVISGENSSDNIGIVNFTWSLVTPEGPLYLHGPKLDISFNYFGFFPITLSVRDSAGNHGEDVINITVLPSGSCVDDDDDDDECDNTSVDDNGTDDDTPGDDEEPEDDDTDDDVGPGDPTRTGSGDENFFSSKEGIGIVIGAVLLVLLMMIFIQRRRDSRAKTDVIELEGEVEENFIDADMEIHEDEVERMNEDDTKDE